MTAGLRGILAFCALALAALQAAPVRTAPQLLPAGPVLLTVTGAVTRPNAGPQAVFDLAMLDALPQHHTVTATPWHEGTPTFSGPLLADILAAAGAGGPVLRVIGLDDYAADIPVSDIESYPVILATRIDGATIPVRAKGPLIVIYPFDRHPELVNEVIVARSVWQVRAIDVPPDTGR
jgi:hypothetical protein